MRFYVIDGNIVYFVESDILTGDIVWANIFREYDSSRDLFQDIWNQGLPPEPMYWEPEQYGYSPKDFEVPIFVDRGDKRSFQSGRYNPNAVGVF